ncbi:arginase, hepatic isoform X1 [Neodiprion virginianus]|uniref:arginase, hepatic isoform X1 n=1 Tax=Neodiprion fabricii TaxID=2872261 RepID=UPI001ED91181|nr:arginase, hepatic isoform X1 [Neodiprion fabricii]XP_046624934.1 arginase, hepatic isoform X1 [Neodiprion virginianus]
MFLHAKHITRQVVKRYYGKVGIVGVPFEAGQEKVGVAKGPHVIRAAGLVKELEVLGIDIKDYGDLSYEVEDVAVKNMTHLGHFAGCTKCLSEKVEQILNDGRQVLTLGGDHSLGVGSIDAHVKVKKDVAVLWIDAHADLNTNATSESGNVHGMPVALLTKELSDYWPYLPGMDWQKPVLSIRSVGYIGLRSVDRYERLVIEKFGINAYGIRDVERYGIHDVVHMALSKVDPENNKSLHVSFDIDSLDPLEAPSTGTPVRGGLTLREGIHLMEEIYNTGRLNAVDLVEVNPHIGTERDVKKTVEAAIQIIQAAFGYNRRGLKVPKGIDDIPLQTFK